MVLCFSMREGSWCLSTYSYRLRLARQELAAQRARAAIMGIADIPGRFYRHHACRVRTALEQAGAVAEVDGPGCSSRIRPEAPVFQCPIPTLKRSPLRASGPGATRS